MTAQLDIFDLLDAPAPQPPFTVYANGARAGQPCGWCHAQTDVGVGAGGGVTDDSTGQAQSIVFDFCSRCAARYGSPRIYRGGTPLVVVQAVI